MNAPYELLVGRDDVVAYLAGAGLLGRVAASPAEVRVDEVTAGNMNRVFIARGPLGSLAVKQAPPWVQVVGPEWPVDPGRIASEARTYGLLAERVPESIPVIVAFDPERYVLVMEDLSALDVLRDALVRQVVSGADAVGIDYAQLGEVVGRFVGELAASTSVSALGPAAHAELVELAANPELCRMTLDVVLDEPYRQHEHNHWHPALDERVAALYVDERMRGAVASIRHDFETRHEALIHGDLHSGSVMIGRPAGAQRVVVFDPEFSFVGPIGMDLGLFWANLELAAIAADAVGQPALAAARRSAIDTSWDAFAEVWDAAGASAPSPSLAAISRDAWRFAGVEGMRRAVGFSHAADIESLPGDVLGEASIRLFDAARHHVLTGEALPAS
ncbi:phosphotransferase [Herbiconiux sp. CPCC 205716]|uniref:Phosphotransferase n=1 Tax=Herbiconiux gentiana TaxID=2970912 RepID=A0ABT2GKV0_9MICO|nr:phosphotransferase [Herbiconiux gentiana]MCS5715549.1 phosphotransferase [Herbiconiux gentiana]